MILNETQKDRDSELSFITGVPIEKIEAEERIASPDSLRIFNTNTIPKTKEGYENLYKDYKYLSINGYYRTLMYTSIFRRNKIIIDALKATRNSTCLDFGSGVGTHTIALLENKNIVDILDVEGPLLNFTLQRIKNRCLNIEGIFTPESKLPNDRYDFVICVDVLEHVFDPIQELIRITKSMKKGGTLCIEVSKMIKNSSGHFKPSIEKWNKEGEKTLNVLFTKVNNFIYKKK